MPRSRLVIFTKAPRSGLAKQRIAAAVGEAEALRIHTELLRSVTTGLRDLRDVELRFTPDDAGAELKPFIQPGWQLAPQGGGDLGQRLGAAFAHHFRSGAERVAIIGSDCPHVTRADILDAWAKLDEHELVLGPAKDGGYWLIALRQSQPELFRDIPWSTDRVLETTLERAQESGLRPELLRELSDVDTLEDWSQYTGSRFGVGAKAGQDVTP